MCHPQTSKLHVTAGVDAAVLRCGPFITRGAGRLRLRAFTPAACVDVENDCRGVFGQWGRLQPGSDELPAQV